MKTFLLRVTWCQRLTYPFRIAKSSAWGRASTGNSPPRAGGFPILVEPCILYGFGSITPIIPWSDSQTNFTVWVNFCSFIVFYLHLIHYGYKILHRRSGGHCTLLRAINPAEIFREKQEIEITYPVIIVKISITGRWERAIFISKFICKIKQIRSVNITVIEKISKTNRNIQVVGRIYNTPPKLDSCLRCKMSISWSIKRRLIDG